MMPANPLATRIGNSASNACNVASRQRYNQNEDDPFTHNVLCLGLTTKLTDRRALTCQSSKTPRHQSQTQTAVRCSALVRRWVLHTQKISGQICPDSPSVPAALRRPER